MSDDANIAWFSRCLVLNEAGILTEEEDRRFRELMREPSCRELFEAFQQGLPRSDDPPEHLPPELVARWDRDKKTLRESEKWAVTKHLARCESCRNELLMLGHEPLLDATPDESASRASQRGSSPTGVGPTLALPTRQVIKMSGRASRHRDQWLRGLLATGWAAAAAMAALLLTTGGPGGSRMGEGSTSMQVGNWIGEKTRGPADAVARVFTSRDGRFVVIPLSLPDDRSPADSVTITLLDEGSATRASYDAVLQDVTYPRLLILHGDGLLTPGHYRLRITPITGGESLEMRLELVATATAPQ